MTLRGWLALLVAIDLVLSLCVSSVVCGAIAVAGIAVLWIERDDAIETPFPFSGDFK
jgi:hypothetical protein